MVNGSDMHDYAGLLVSHVFQYHNNIVARERKLKGDRTHSDESPTAHNPKTFQIIMGRKT